MGSSNSTLPPPSQPGSPLQVCLNNVFSLNASGVSYPQDLLYQFSDVKPYNTAISVTPAAVTRPNTAEDVAKIVQCAAASSVKVQARSGGHSYGNYGIGGEDGAVVVDMATIGSGTLLADVTTRLHAAGGRAIAHGTCPQVGIGGHATIGGLGPISRQWGAALDHVLGVEIVLANGTITRANATYNPDILFAVKGAAASFGIVTEFVFMTRPEPPNAVIYSYKLLLRKHAALAPTFAAWQDIVADPALDRKLASHTCPHFSHPDLCRDHLRIIPSPSALGTYFGTRDEYNQLNFEARLAQHATAVSVSVVDDWLGVVGHWAETEALKVVGGIPGPFYSKSLTFKATTLIPTAGIQELFGYFDTADKGTLVWFAIFDVEGGAVNDVAQDATAYAHRDAQFYMQTYAVGVGALSAATSAFVTHMSDIVTGSMPGVQFGAYAGYVDPKLADGPRRYWGSNLPRLQRIKAAVDPDDVFHNPQSVSPVAGNGTTEPGGVSTVSSASAQGESRRMGMGGIDVGREYWVLWRGWLLRLLGPGYDEY
ncbi:hypothetical protein B0H14DRAFT_3485964 [Mycena olivaceomarginata]|nr:hypothetical protein B0H14DRAFT_3485964 [Mycena olivaceomarginata]